MTVEGDGHVVDASGHALVSPPCSQVHDSPSQKHCALRGPEQPTTVSYVEQVNPDSLHDEHPEQRVTE